MRYMALALGVLIGTGFVAAFPTTARSQDVEIILLDTSITMGFRDPSCGDRERLEAAKTFIATRWALWPRKESPDANFPDDFLVYYFNVIESKGDTVKRAANIAQVNGLTTEFRPFGVEAFYPALEQALDRAWTLAQGPERRRVAIFYYTDNDLILPQDTNTLLASKIGRTENKLDFLERNKVLIQEGWLSLNVMVLASGSMDPTTARVLKELGAVIFFGGDTRPGGIAERRLIWWSVPTKGSGETVWLGKRDEAGLAAPVAMPPLRFDVVMMPGLATNGKFRVQAKLVGPAEREVSLAPSEVPCETTRTDLAITLPAGPALPAGTYDLLLHVTPEDFTPQQLKVWNVPPAQQVTVKDYARIAYASSTVEGPRPVEVEVEAGRPCDQSVKWTLTHPPAFTRQARDFPFTFTVRIDPKPADGAFFVNGYPWSEVELSSTPESPLQSISVQVRSGPTKEGKHTITLTLSGRPFGMGSVVPPSAYLTVGKTVAADVSVTTVGTTVGAPGAKVDFKPLSVQPKNLRACGTEISIGPAEEVGNITSLTIATSSGLFDLLKSAAIVKVPSKIGEAAQPVFSLTTPPDSCADSSSFTLPVNPAPPGDAPLVNGEKQVRLRIGVTLEVPKVLATPLAPPRGICSGRTATYAAISIQAANVAGGGREVLIGPAKDVKGIDAILMGNYNLAKDSVPVTIPTKPTDVWRGTVAVTAAKAFAGPGRFTLPVRGKGVVVNGQPQAADVRCDVVIGAVPEARVESRKLALLFSGEMPEFPAFAVAAGNNEACGGDIAVGPIDTASVVGLDALTLVAPSGQRFNLLGPNAAPLKIPGEVGKTDLYSVIVQVKSKDYEGPLSFALPFQFDGNLIVDGKPAALVRYDTTVKTKPASIAFSVAATFRKIVPYGFQIASDTPIEVATQSLKQSQRSVLLGSNLQKPDQASVRTANDRDTGVILKREVLLPDGKASWWVSLMLARPDGAKAGESSNRTFYLTMENLSAEVACQGWERQADGAARGVPIEVQAVWPAIAVKEAKDAKDAPARPRLQVVIPKGKKEGLSEALRLELRPSAEALAPAFLKELGKHPLVIVCRAKDGTTTAAVEAVDDQGNPVSGNLADWLVSGRSFHLKTLLKEDPRSQDMTQYTVEVGGAPQDVVARAVSTLFVVREKTPPWEGVVLALIAALIAVGIAVAIY
ncbi:MAG: hypothetical protein NT049_00730, partial [Planctomycetota bacterium]|nr:hypothetical protein [Planctomycetota bacterium]